MERYKTLSVDETRELLAKLTNVGRNRNLQIYQMNYDIDTIYMYYDFTFDEFNTFLDSLYNVSDINTIKSRIEKFKMSHKLKTNNFNTVSSTEIDTIIPATVLNNTEEYDAINNIDSVGFENTSKIVMLKNSIVDKVSILLSDENKEFSEAIIDSVINYIDTAGIMDNILVGINNTPVIDIIKNIVDQYYTGTSDQKKVFKDNLNKSIKDIINKYISFSDEGNIVEEMVSDVVDIYPNADLPDDLVANDDYSVNKSTSSVPNETLLIEEKPITKNEPIIINSKTGSIPIEGKASSKEYREIDEKTNKKDKKTTNGGTVMYQEKNKKGKKDKKQDEKKTVNQNNEEVATIEPSHQMVNILNRSDPRYLTQIIETYCVNPRVFDSGIFINSYIEQYKQAIPIVIGGALLPGIENGTIPNLYSQGYRLIINPIGPDPNNICEIRIVALKSHDTTMTEHPELFEIIISNPFDFYNYEANTFINGVYQHNMKSRMYDEE